MPDFNIIIKSSAWQEGDDITMFADRHGDLHGEEVLYLDAPSLEVLYRDLGIYKSSSEAKRAGKGGPIPTGYSELKASKKCRVYMWNPTE